jgi:hypothetical protein
MKLARLLPCLAVITFAATAHATVERKFSYRAETADAYIPVTSADGCRTTWLSVLNTDSTQRTGGTPKLHDVFAVVHVDIYDQCTDEIFSGYADTSLEQNTFTLDLDPQHDRARLQAHLIMQDDTTFTFYWADIDASWAIGGPATTIELKDELELGDGLTLIRTQGEFEVRPAHVTATIDVVPYFPGTIVNHLIGEGISASFDSSDTPAELQEFNRYSKMKSGDRTIYRTYDYVGP